MIFENKRKILLTIITCCLIMIPINNNLTTMGAAIPTDVTTNSEDVKISISKNSTAIGSHSTLEFTVKLVNTLSESIYSVQVFANQDSPYIELSPTKGQVYSIPTLEPESSAEFSVTAKIKGEITTSSVDLMLIIDASGSMGEEIDSIKNKLTSLTETFSEEIPDLRMGVIVYGWGLYSEYPSNQENQLPFTTDFDLVKYFINKLRASGGVEPWGDALWLANTFDWRLASQKLIIMVGDEDCDGGNIIGRNAGEYYNGSELVAVVSSLKDKGVKINTVVSDDPDSNVVNQFHWISRYTGGKSVFLPELESQGIDLPSIIEEWTLELSREYGLYFNVTVLWQDGSNVLHRNERLESFWLDLAFPSIVVSETVYSNGLNLFSVRFIAEVADFSPVNFVTLYHKASGMWETVSMVCLPNSSKYLAEVSNIPGQYNLSYFVEASDILNNIGTTPDQWMIVEPPLDAIGEKKTIWAEPEDQIVAKFESENTNSYYLILSGKEDLNSIVTEVNVLGSPTLEAPFSKTFVVVSNKTSRLILSFDLFKGVFDLNIKIPYSSMSFTFSYVWVLLDKVTGEYVDTHYYENTFDEKIRVQGIQWDPSNGSYFVVDYTPTSDLVVYGEVYTDDWTFLGRFTVNEFYHVSEPGTYFVIIWATLRTGEYRVITTYSPIGVDDPYYKGIEVYGSAGIPALVSVLSTIIGLLIVVQIFHKKNRKKT